MQASFQARNRSLAFPVWPTGWGRGHFVPGGARLRPAPMSLYQVGQGPTSTCGYCHRCECRTGGCLADRTSFGQNPTIRFRFLGTPGRIGLGSPASNSSAVSIDPQTPRWRSPGLRVPNSGTSRSRYSVPKRFVDRHSFPEVRRGADIYSESGIGSGGSSS